MLKVQYQIQIILAFKQTLRKRFRILRRRNRILITSLSEIHVSNSSSSNPIIELIGNSDSNPQHFQQR